MSQPSYAHATLASSIKVKERSIEGGSKPLLGLTFKRAVSKFKKTLQRKDLNGRSIAETTPILPGIRASIASENLSALLIQVDTYRDGALRGDRHLRKTTTPRRTIYATYHGDESREISYPAPVPAAFSTTPAPTSSLVSAVNDVINEDIFSSWLPLDAPTPASLPATVSSLMADIEDLLLCRDSNPARETSSPCAASDPLTTPPATPLLVARPALDGKAAPSAVRHLRIMKKKPATSSLRAQYQEHHLPTPPASPLPEPSISLPVPTSGERIEEALAALYLLQKTERMEKALQEGKIQRRQQWAEWALEPMPTSPSVETIKPARAAPTVDTEDDTDYYMCLCPLGRATSAEEQTASRTAHVERYLTHPPEDFLHDRAYHALLRRWGHLVPELPGGSPVPEEFFRSMLV